MGRSTHTCTSRTARRSRVIDNIPFYYGWIVVAATTLGKAMTIPGQTAGVSLFIDGFIADLGLSRSSVSMAYTVATLIGAASLTYVGRWIDRFGPRRSVVVITAAFALACLYMGYVGGVLTLFLGFTLLRALGQGSLSLASIHVVNLWFVRRRGTAVGLLGVGLALAMSFFPVLIEELISRFGWRTTYMLLGGGLAAIWCYGIMFGLVQGMQDAIKGSVYAYYFGRAHIGAIKGFSKTLAVGGTAVGPLVFALGRDYLGSYLVSFGASALVAFMLGVTALLIKGREMQPLPGLEQRQTVAG